MKKTIIRALILAVVLLSLLALPVSATALSDEPAPSFDKFLELLSGPFISAAVGVVLSFVIEWFPAYNALPSRAKRLLYFGLCLLIPVAAACLRAALDYVPWSFDPLVWNAIVAGVTAGGAGTLAHVRKLSAA